MTNIPLPIYILFNYLWLGVITGWVNLTNSTPLNQKLTFVQILILINFN